MGRKDRWYVILVDFCDFERSITICMTIKESLVTVTLETV